MYVTLTFHSEHIVEFLIQWPGYDEWKDNMAITDNTVERRSFTLGQLAHAVAKAVYKFHFVRASYVRAGLAADMTVTGLAPGPVKRGFLRLVAVSD